MFDFHLQIQSLLSINLKHQNIQNKQIIDHHSRNLSPLPSTAFKSALLKRQVKALHLLLLVTIVQGTKRENGNDILRYSKACSYSKSKSTNRMDLDCSMNRLKHSLPLSPSLIVLAGHDFLISKRVTL